MNELTGPRELGLATSRAGEGGEQRSLIRSDSISLEPKQYCAKCKCIEAYCLPRIFIAGFTYRS